MAQSTTTIAAERVEEVRFGSATPKAAAVTPSTTTGTYWLPLEALKHSLSSRPLRRPSRNRPLD